MSPRSGKIALATFVLLGACGTIDYFRVEQAYRRQDVMRLEQQSKSGDLMASKEMMYSPRHSIADEEAAS